MLHDLVEYERFQLKLWKRIYYTTKLIFITFYSICIFPFSSLTQGLLHDLTQPYSVDYDGTELIKKYITIQELSGSRNTTVFSL